MNIIADYVSDSDGNSDTEDRDGNSDTEDTSCKRKSDNNHDVTGNCQKKTKASDLNGKGKLLPLPTGVKLPPPTGVKLPPPTGVKLPPPTGVKLPPPTGVKLPPPTGVKLPPPTGVKDMFETTPDKSDDDLDNHDGRLRSFPHERGNWASYVYISVDRGLQDALEDLTESLVAELRPVVEFQACEDFHLSLSRTFVLKHHWINAMMSSLRHRLSSCQQTTLTFGELEIYSNDEDTRSFLALKVCGGQDKLRCYIQAIDSSLSEYHLPEYYKEPSFHISLAWATGNVTSRITGELNSRFQAILEEHKDSSLPGSFPVTEVTCRTGNKQFPLSLKR